MTARLILMAVMALGCFSAQAQLKLLPKERIDSVANPPLAPDAGILKFDAVHIDAGEINETDAPTTYSYRFVNVGDRTVRINRIVTTCSCMTAAVVDKDIAPGEEGSVTLRYNPKGHPGGFERRVFVYTDDNRQPSAVLRLKVNVRAGDGTSDDFPEQMGWINADRRSIIFDRTVSDTRTIRFVNKSGRRLKMECETMMLAPCLSFDADPETVENGETGCITVFYDSKVGAPASGKASVMLKNLGVPPLQSTIAVIFK